MVKSWNRCQANGCGAPLLRAPTNLHVTPRSIHIGISLAARNLPPPAGVRGGGVWLPSSSSQDEVNQQGPLPGSLRQPSRSAPSAQNQVKENEDDHGQQHVTEAHCSWPIPFYLPGWARVYQPRRACGIVTSPPTRYDPETHTDGQEQSEEGGVHAGTDRADGAHAGRLSLGRVRVGAVATHNPG